MHRPLYLKIVVSGVGLGAGLLYVKEEMNCGHDEVPDNVTLNPITFAIKCLSSAEWWYSNIKWEPLAYYMVSRCFTITVLSKKYV